MQVAVFTGRFPEVSETFVLDHVTGLLDRQVQVQVHAVQRGNALRHADFAAYRLEELTRIGATLPRQSWRRGLQLLTARPYALTDALALMRARANGAGPMEAWHEYQLACSLQVRPLRPSIFHVHFAGLGNAVAGLLRRGVLQGPLVASVHGYDVTHAVHQGLRPYDLLFRSAARVLVTTGFMADQAARAGCPEGKITRLPLGVRLDKLPFAQRRLAAGATPILLTVGRLVEKKGHQVALRALARVAAAGVDFRYWILGAGPEEALLRRLATELGLDAQVEFLGPQPRETVIQRLAEAHLFLLPGVCGSNGDQEGQGIVLQEAQACGLPVLTTRLGGIPEGVAEGKSAEIAAPGDDQDLAEKILALLRSPERWSAMGRAGRDFVAAHYDYRQTMDRLLAIYADVLKP